MTNLIDIFLEHQSEFWNAVFAISLIFSTVVLIKELRLNLRSYHTGVTVSCLIILIVLGMRLTYYINAIAGVWNRSSHGTVWVAWPSPFLWGAFCIVAFGYISQIRYTVKIEHLLQKSYERGQPNEPSGNDNNILD